MRTVSQHTPEGQRDDTCSVNPGKRQARGCLILGRYFPLTPGKADSREGEEE